MTDLFMLVWCTVVGSVTRGEAAYRFWGETVGMTIWLTLIGIALVAAGLGAVVLIGVLA